MWLLAYRSVRVTLDRGDFPANLATVTVDEIVLYLVPADGDAVPAVRVTLGHAGKGGAATSQRGVISTRRGNAATWTTVRNTAADGAWDLTFSADAAAFFDAGRVVDVLLVITGGGAGPRWTP